MESPISSRPSSTARSDISFATAIDTRPESRDDPHAIAHDLETLKKQVRRRSQAARLSQASARLHEASNGFHYNQTAELEEEVRWLREELQQVRAEREDEKEAAEQRIAELERQNESLSVLVDQQRDDAKIQRNISDQAVQKAWADLRGHEVELDILRNRLAQTGGEADRLRKACSDEQASREALLVENQSLQLQVEKALGSTERSVEVQTAGGEAAEQYKQKIANLEETNRVAGERMQSVISSHKAREESLLQKYSELQSRHDDLMIQFASSRSRINDLEASVLDHESRRQDLLSQVDGQKQHLHDANLEVEKHSQELSQLLHNYQSAKKDREEFRALLQESLGCTTEMEEKLRVAEHRAAKAEQALDAAALGSSDVLTRELAQSNEELAEVRVEVLTMHGQLAEAQVRAGEAESELEERKGAFRADLLAKSNKVLELQRQLNELQTSHDILKVDPSTRDGEVVTLRRQVAKLQRTQDKNRDLLERTELEASMAADVVARSVKDAETRLETAAAAREKEYRDALAKAKATREMMQADMDALVKANATRELTQGDIDALQKKHEAALSQLRKDLHKSHEEKLVKLEEKHEQALTSALADADDDMEGRMRDQARTHGEELEALQQELSNLQTQLSEVEAYRRDKSVKDTAMEELTARLNSAEQAFTEMNSKHEALAAESAALQARLEAEMMARTDAELIVADLRKRQRASIGDKKVDDDTKEALQRRVVVLQAERDALVKQTESASPSPSTPQRNAPLAPPLDDAPLSPEVEGLRQQNLELSRQNDFLAKELEGVMSRFGTPATADPQPEVVNAAVQTEKAVDLATNGSSRERGDQFNKDTFGHHESLRLESIRSINEFLEQAERDLASLTVDSVETSEELLSRKLHEHVSDLEIAKTQLAKEYKAKYNALLTQKQNMERTVMAKTAFDFHQKHDALLANYRVFSSRHLSSPTQQAMRDAEGRLVAEHDRIHLLRKSQVSLKHVADLQTITEDYDRKISSLLNGRDQFSQGPAVRRALSPRPEKNFHELEQKSSRSELRAIFNNEEANGSAARGLPPRNSDAGGTQSSEQNIETTDFAVQSSHLRKASKAGGRTTIPRAVPYSGRASLDRNTGSRQLEFNAAAAASNNLPTKIPSEPYQPIQQRANTATALHHSRRHQQPQQRLHDPDVSPYSASAMKSSVDAEELAEQNFGTFTPIPESRHQYQSSPAPSSGVAASDAMAKKKIPRPEKKKKARSNYSSGLIYLQAADG